ncbi:MAG: type I secretion C-terminal target domain-containing protein, partial [Psychromonas sp.]|nr:type I secretion C-terminal target domain-containing protein [Psychromonas sp.]
VDTTQVVSTITDGSPVGSDDTVTVKLVAVDADAVEGEAATYQVQLTDALGGVVIATENMEVTFSYTYKDGNNDDVTETDSVILLAGQSEVNVSVATLDDVFAEGTEDFTVAINTVSNQGQFEKVVVDNSKVASTITDEAVPGVEDTVTVNLVAWDNAAGTALSQSQIVEGETAFYKVIATDADRKVITNGTADVETKNISAVSSESDYVAFKKTVNFGKVIAINTGDDSVDELMESFKVSIVNVTAPAYENVIPGTSVITNIKDNDFASLQMFSIGVEEGSLAQFTVAVAKASVGSKLTLSLQDGTALDDDYFASDGTGKFEYSLDKGETWQAITGDISVGKGDSTVLVQVDTVDDKFHEKNEMFNLNVVLTSVGNVTVVNASATISDNDTPPEFLSGSDTDSSGANVDVYQFNDVAEYSKEGTIVGTVNAYDTEKDIQGYSFANGSLKNGPFDIEAGTGVISLNKDIVDVDLDAYNLLVQVVDASGGIDTATVNVNLIHVNTVPEFEKDSYSFDYKENSFNSTVLGTVVASDKDGDNVTLSISNGPTTDGKPLFEINADGEITLTVAGVNAYSNDFETESNTHILTVLAKDGKGGEKTVDVTLNETDVKEFTGPEYGSGAGVDTYIITTDLNTPEDDSIMNLALATYWYHHAGQRVAFQYTGGNPAVLLTDNLLINSGFSNDYVNLSISSGNNTVYTGSSISDIDIRDPLLQGNSFIDTLMKNGITEVEIGQLLGTNLQPLADSVYMGSGHDTVIGGGGNLVVYAGAGNDLVIGNDQSVHTNDQGNETGLLFGDDALRGGAGNDTLAGKDGNDTLRGDGGNDFMFGGSGNDILIGDSGEDTLIGGLGADTMTGGTGADTFAWLEGEHGTDHVQDFNVEQGDKLDLSDLFSNDTAYNLGDFLDFSFAKGNTTITVHADAGDQFIILDGLDLQAKYGDGATVGSDLLETNIVNGLLQDGALIIADTPSEASSTIAELTEDGII